MQNPNVHGLDKDLSFRVEQIRPGGAHDETLRSISLNGNIDVGRAAFFAAVKHYPARHWILKWGAYIVERYDPPAELQKKASR